MARIEFVCSDEQKGVYEKAAQSAKRKLGDWIRLVADEAAGQGEFFEKGFAPRESSALKSCDHAGTELGKLSGVGSCPKCGKTVTAKEMK